MRLKERLDAMEAGRRAALAGRPFTDCPYPQDTPTGRALASAWVREWTRNQPDPTVGVSYDD